MLLYYFTKFIRTQIHTYWYMATCREMRELVIRGVDGPGMHAMDVCPHSYDTAPEHEEVYEKRKKWVEKMLSRPPKQYTREAGTKHPDVYAAVCANVVKVGWCYLCCMPFFILRAFICAKTILVNS